ncbi:MAG: hypothetical protein J2P20_11360 [Pseudonocardia sp.]|nr:hypothetical protein [Pseudonocardia sp.]
MSTTVDPTTTPAPTSPLTGAMENKADPWPNEDPVAADNFGKVHDAGCDGVQANFVDYLPDPRLFGERVVPLMVEAGLRKQGA